MLALITAFKLVTRTKLLVWIVLIDPRAVICVRRETDRPGFEGHRLDDFEEMPIDERWLTTLGWRRITVFTANNICDGAAERSPDGGLQS
jgi:hypothetical protein